MWHAYEESLLFAENEIYLPIHRNCDIFNGCEIFPRDCECERSPPNSRLASLAKYHLFFMISFTLHFEGFILIHICFACTKTGHGSTAHGEVIYVRHKKYIISFIKTKKYIKQEKS